MKSLTPQGPSSSHDTSFELPSQQPDFDALAQSIPSSDSSSSHGQEPEPFLSEIEASSSDVPSQHQDCYLQPQPHHSGSDPSPDDPLSVLNSPTPKERKRTSLLSVGRRFSQRSASSSVGKLQPDSRRQSISSQRKHTIASRVDWTLNLAFLGVAPHPKVIQPPAQTKQIKLPRRNSSSSSIDSQGRPRNARYRSYDPNKPFTIIEEDQEPSIFDSSAEGSQVKSDEVGNMGLMRHLTRRARSPPRMGSLKKGTTRPQISLPTNIISATNGLVYDAPDLYKKQHHEASSPTSSHHSRGSSDGTDASNEPSLTDASSVGSSSPLESPQTAYFPGGALTPSAPRDSHGQAETNHSQEAPPAIPRRSPSHTRREHERLARARSLRSSIGARPVSLQPGSYLHDDSLINQDVQLQKPLQHGPFSNELEQLQEVAEEFNAVHIESDPADDNRVMSMKGLNTFRASEYMNELGTGLTPFDENAERWL